MLFLSCKDNSLHSDTNSNSVQSTAGMEWDERVLIGKNSSVKETKKLSRWDSPWWEMSHATLSDSILAVNGRVMIGFKNPGKISGVDLQGKVLTNKNNIENAKRALKVLGVQQIEDIEKIPAVSALIESTPELIESIRNHPLVDYIEPDGPVRVLGKVTFVDNSNISFQSQTIPWNLTQIQAPQVWNRTTGSGVIVHIIDTGVTDVLDLDPDFRYSNGGGFDDFEAGHGHGTLIAGITSALDNTTDQVGIAYDANLWGAKVPQSSSSTTSFITSAIGYGRTNDTFVINLSFALDPNTALTDQIVGAYNVDGLLLVAAAGVTSASSDVLYPAWLNEVIAVASVDEYNNQSTFSPTGSEIEISAPGEDLISTSKNGGLSGFIDGTSFAAPHVAGAAALLKSYNPSWSNVEIRNLLNQTALNLGSSSAFGNGLVQVREAIRITASINGPVTYSSSANYFWNASVEKADGTVSYQWHKKPQGTSTWQALGTSSSQSLYLTSSSGHFQLRVTVDDGFETNEAIKIVNYVNDGDCPPTEICS